MVNYFSSQQDSRIGLTKEHERAFALISKCDDFAKICCGLQRLAQDAVDKQPSSADSEAIDSIDSLEIAIRKLNTNRKNCKTDPCMFFFNIDKDSREVEVMILPAIYGDISYDDSEIAVFLHDLKLMFNMFKVLPKLKDRCAWVFLDNPKVQRIINNLKSHGVDVSLNPNEFLEWVESEEAFNSRPLIVRKWRIILRNLFQSVAAGYKEEFMARLRYHGRCLGQPISMDSEKSDNDTLVEGQKATRGHVLAKIDLVPGKDPKK